MYFPSFPKVFRRPVPGFPHMVDISSDFSQVFVVFFKYSVKRCHPAFSWFPMIFNNVSPFTFVCCDRFPEHVVLVFGERQSERMYVGLWVACPPLFWKFLLELGCMGKGVELTGTGNL